MRTAIFVDLDSLNASLAARGDARLFSPIFLRQYIEADAEIVSCTMYSGNGFNRALLTKMVRGGVQTRFNLHQPPVSIAIDCACSDADMVVIATDNYALLPVCEHLKSIGREVLLFCINPHRAMHKHAVEIVSESLLHERKHATPVSA